MAVNQELVTFIEDQLSEFGKVDMRSMFGGVGIFKDGLMFAKIGGDTFRLKVGESNQPDFEAYGMKPYFSEKKKKGMPYWEVPEEVINDRSLLKTWAKKAYQGALDSKK